MKITSYIFPFILGMTLASCATLSTKNRPISTTNQAPTQQKIITNTSSKNEVLPDGTPVTKETIIYEDKQGNITKLINVKERKNDTPPKPQSKTPPTPKTNQTNTTNTSTPKTLNNSNKLPNTRSNQESPKNPNALPNSRTTTASTTNSLPRPRPTDYQTSSSSNQATNLGPKNIDTARDVANMTTREKDMIREINLVRSNPKAYIKYILSYKDEAKNYTDPNFASQQARAIESLIKELETMEPAAILSPRTALQQTAQKHGTELQNRGESSHVGMDGSFPWTRITRDDPTLNDGNENLIGGLAEVRDAIITLLIDAGVSGYGHRKTLLNPTWKYVACYEIGNIRELPYNWIQCFAK